MFNKILIANRGEIACRIARSARALGIRSVAVYSDADRGAPHVDAADESRYIGAAPASASYLDGDKIIAAAGHTGAEAIHPGYGFLSENPDFAAACERAGSTFIGPSPEVIRSMGSKREAKALMANNGVPVVPGYDGTGDDKELATAAAELGFPLLIKASAGGGGRGMRLVENATNFADSLRSARREAVSAFGSDAVLLEKYIESPRHIEVQILGDQTGRVVHFFTRDCSVQRRYQKLIEEAPASDLSAEQIDTMHHAAVRAGEIAGYVGAGTVEFVVARDGAVHFIEMNTRLQVEHPVTEAITGEDLVAWQFKIAAGERLPEQDRITAGGHAIELRLCAEDSHKDFAPATGVITHFATPHNIRIDHGIATGVEVTPYYDSMIAKLIVSGADRDQALQGARAALAGTEVAGLTTNREFLRHILANTAFNKGGVDTHFIEQHSEDLIPPLAPVSDTALALATLYLVSHRQVHRAAGASVSSPWQLPDAFRLNLEHREVFTFHDDAAREYEVTLEHHSSDFTLALPSGSHACAIERCEPPELIIVVAEQRHRGHIIHVGATLEIFVGGEHFVLHHHDPLHATDKAEATAGDLSAPMPGTVLEVFVQAGDVVAAGAPLLLLEAMKIEHTITAPYDGTIDAIFVAAGDQIDVEGFTLAAMSPSDPQD